MTDASEKTSPEPVADRPVRAGETPSQILLIEDDETLANLLARVLRNEGYHVDLLDRADMLPPAAKLIKYDVVLSDIHLAEGTSGHDVLKQVRQVTDKVPVILMTSQGSEEISSR